MKRILSILTLCLVAAVPLMATDGSAHATADAFGLFTMLMAGAMSVTYALRGLGLRLAMFGLFAFAIDATALNTAYGAEFRDSSKNRKHMRSLLYESAEFDKLFTVEYIKESIWERGVSDLGAIIQRFQIPFTPSGTLNLTPSTIKLGDIKADILTSSHELKRTWAGFLHKNDNTPQTMQEFIKWLVNEHLQSRWNHDIEMSLSYLGVEAPVVPNTAGSVTGAMNGFKYVLNQHITDGALVPISMGALPTGPGAAVATVNYIEDMMKQMPNVIKNKPMTLAVAYHVEELFKEGMRLKYNTYYRDADDVLKVYVRKNVTVQGFAAMGDSDKMFATMKENLIKPVNLKDSPDWRFEDQDRSIKIFTDKMVGYGVWIPQYVVTNDVELTNESSD
jgi:hypothetical protein